MVKGGTRLCLYWYGGVPCLAGHGYVDNGCGGVPLCLTDCFFVLSMVGSSLEPAW